MDKRIEKFIKRHHVMTLATVDPQGEPWCSNIFYAYLPESQELIFTSGESTAHVSHALARAEVGVSIVLESKIISKLQGVQIKGTMQRTSHDQHRDAFLKAFPYAVFSLKEMWVIEMTYAKYTDNTLGFGTKLTYTK